jgi:carbon monoxide dehydrogenase subunit G
MPGFTLSKQVAAPPATVFAVFSDLEHAAGRIQAISKLELVTPGPVGAGTRFRETRKMFGKDCTEEMQITAFEPGRGYEVSAHSCGAEFRTIFRFTPDGAGTRVDVEFQTLALSFFAKLMRPLSWLTMGTIRKCVNQDLEDLKRYLTTDETRIEHG